MAHTHTCEVAHNILVDRRQNTDRDGEIVLYRGILLRRPCNVQGKDGRLEKTPDGTHGFLEFFVLLRGEAR